MYSISILTTFLVKRKGPVYILYILLHVKVIHVFVKEYVGYRKALLLNPHAGSDPVSTKLIQCL